MWKSVCVGVYQLLYSATHSLSLALYRGGLSKPRPGRFNTGKETLPILQRVGWAPWPVWTDAVNIVPHRDLIPWPSSRKRVAIPTTLLRPAFSSDRKKTGFSRQNLIDVLNTKFHGIPSSRSRADTYGGTSDYVKAPKIPSCTVFGFWNSASQTIQNCTVSTDVATCKLRNMSSIHCEFWIVVTDFACFGGYLKIQYHLFSVSVLKTRRVSCYRPPMLGRGGGAKIWTFLNTGIRKSII